MLADLPFEILVSLLCRLPVKPLIKFRSVSKPLRSVIDSVHFVDLHLNNSRETRSHRCLILGRNSELYYVDLDPVSDAVELPHPLMCYRNQIVVLGSIDGLVCISNVAEDIALWNPSIKRHKILPFLPIERNSELGPSLPITRVFGFGYDPINEDYKLVRISQFILLGYEKSVAKVKVYSQRANAWKDSEDMPYVCMNKKNGIFVKTSLHWVVNRKFNVDETDLIVAFNLTNETFREVPLPECVGERFRIELGVLDQCLCMIVRYEDVRADLWVMRDYRMKASWAKLFSVTAAEEVDGSIKNLRPLSYSKTGGEVLLEQDGRRLVWYDLRDKKIQNFSVDGLPNWFEAEICIESLLPVEASRRNHGKKKTLREEKCNRRDDFLSEGFKLVL